jgi:ubiquitin C-terminal hydrolase
MSVDPSSTRLRNTIRPPRLLNLGSICYLNALFHYIVSTPEFVNVLFSYLPIDKFEQTRQAMVDYGKRIYYYSEYKNYPPLNISTVVTELNIDGNCQQDVHETWSGLMQALEHCEPSHCQDHCYPGMKHQSECYFLFTSQTFLAFYQSLSDSTSPTNFNIPILNIKTIKHQTCSVSSECKRPIEYTHDLPNHFLLRNKRFLANAEKDSYQHTNYVALNLPKSRGVCIHLTELLKHFGKRRDLEPNEQYCYRLNGSTAANENDNKVIAEQDKIIFERKTPSVIPVVINRFKGNMNKDHTHVTIPEIIDFTPIFEGYSGDSLSLTDPLLQFRQSVLRFNQINPNKLSTINETVHTKSIDDSNSLIYRLHTFIIHEGNDIYSGHYITYVCTDQDNSIPTKDRQWWRVDDTKVERVSMREAHSAASQAYMLSFVKNIN